MRFGVSRFPIIALFKAALFLPALPLLRIYPMSFFLRVAHRPPAVRRFQKFLASSAYAGCASSYLF